MNKYAIYGLLVGLALAATAQALPTMDGSLAGDQSFYGAALSTQNTKTGFGDAILGDPVNGGGGSEIDQVYGKVANGRLYVFVSGNLEQNFNKMEVFIDSENNLGVNTINGSALPVGVDPFCCGGFGTTSGALQRMNGVTFDAGFKPGYYLTFSNGGEGVGPPNPDLSHPTQFWAISAHYADLTQGAAGAVVAAGYQLAPNGQPKVLRFPGDYNHNGTVDAADYTVWRDSLGKTVSKGTGADADGSTVVDAADYSIWQTQFGNDTTLNGFPFKPNNLAGGVTQALIGPALPGLAQGQLIDRNYALGAGGCANDTGAECAAKELQFALNVDPNEVGTNASNHRNFNNTVDLQMGFDNSNKVGVRGSGGPFGLDTNDDPQDVTTGLEFSIPLSKIGTPSGNIKLMAFVNGTGHDFISNQVSGTGVFDADAGTGGNIGTAFFAPSPLGSFLDIPGDQFVTISNPGAGSAAGVPEPASVVLLIVGMLFGGRMMRRQA
jgi:hypothetical protein